MVEDSSRKYYEFPPAGGGTSGGGTGLNGTATTTASGPAGNTQAGQGERAPSPDLGGTAQDVVRRAGEQVAMTADAARHYLARNVDAYPLVSVLLAGLLGYGLGYLIHGGWQGGPRVPGATVNRSEIWRGSGSDFGK